MVHNVNCLIKKGGTDTTVDKTSWANGSYADVHSRIKGKKMSKGGQHVLVLDTKRRYVYGYTARHKYFERKPPFTQEGPAKVKRLLDTLDGLIVGAARPKEDVRRQIFDEPPHICMDNHFSGDHVCKYIGEKGYKATMTCRRDRLPQTIDKKYLHHKKDISVDYRTKAARFMHPIVAVKDVLQPPGSEAKDYSLCHVSFQSTGSTNISTVNALDKVELYVRKRCKGRGKTKRTWGIEMNEGRESYLKNYSAVDKIDQELGEWALNYFTWKWWHASMRHGKAIGYSQAYHLYCHCAEGTVRPEWKVEKPLSAPEFRAKLAAQMCRYRAANLEYPGDRSMRNATRLSSKKRSRRGRNRMETRLEKCEDDKFRVSYRMFLDAKAPRGRSSRLCSDNLQLLKEHLNSFEKACKGRCQMCGYEKCYMKCKKCNKHCCFKSELGMASVSCSIDMHDDNFFGLAMDDRVELFGEMKSRFKKATTTEVNKNKKHIQKLRKKYEEDMGNSE